MYPNFLPFCLATNIGRPPSGSQWIHEIKFDGYRTQLHVRGEEVVIYTKNGHDWTERYRSVAEEARTLKVQLAVIDGDMVVLRPDQTCDMWGLLRDTRNGLSDRLTLFAFDLLFVDGDDLRKWPLLERKERLRSLLGGSQRRQIKFCDHFDLDGPTVWAHAHEFNVEGIISKRAGSPYRGLRGEDWIKTPCQYRETVPVVGMALEGDRLTGLYLARKIGGKLHYAGQLEEGLTDEIRTKLIGKLTPYATKHPPVDTATPKSDARWVDAGFKVRIVHRGGVERSQFGVLCMKA